MRTQAHDDLTCLAMKLQNWRCCESLPRTIQHARPWPSHKNTSSHRLRAHTQTYTTLSPPLASLKISPGLRWNEEWVIQRRGSEWMNERCKEKQRNNREIGRGACDTGRQTIIIVPLVEGRLRSWLITNAKCAATLLRLTTTTEQKRIFCEPCLIRFQEEMYGNLFFSFLSYSSFHLFIPFKCGGSFAPGSWQGAWPNNEVVCARRLYPEMIMS